jgi:hypothetical protein
MPDRENRGREHPQARAPVVERFRVRLGVVFGQCINPWVEGTEELGKGEGEFSHLKGNQ